MHATYPPSAIHQQHRASLGILNPPLVIPGGGQLAAPIWKTPVHKFQPCSLTAKSPFKPPPMQQEPVAMHHQLSSPQKSCSPEGQQTACPSPPLPDTPHLVSTLPCHLPFPCSHVSGCGRSKPAGCQTQLLFSLLLRLPWEIILIPPSAHLYYLV